MARLMGMPTSPAITCAISAMRAWRPSPMRCTYLARSVTGVSAHEGNARRAAVTALSTSPGVPSGIRPMTSSVVEFTTSSQPVPVDGTHAPSMYSLSVACTLSSSRWRRPHPSDVLRRRCHLELAQRGKKLALRPVEEGVLLVLPDLHQCHIGEAGVEELLHRFDVELDVGAARDLLGHIVLGDELRRRREVSRSG